MMVTAAAAEARLVRLRIERREVVLAGKPFGLAGPYEKLVGKADFALDPALPQNQIIVDLLLAPRNARGEVEFSADFYLLKPVDPQKGNGRLFYEVGNRGGKSALVTFQKATGSPDPTNESDFGDGSLMRQGFTLLWMGWQWDVPDGRMRMEMPIATRNGAAITGLVRGNFILNQRASTASLAWGVSQSGRFLRHFLYQGFNEDEQGRRVFDGVLDQVGGAGRGSFNHRFAQASRDALEHFNILFPVDMFPFTDAPQTDPETGVTDALLARSDRSGTTPKVFHILTNSEYFNRAGSLVHTDPAGTRDAELPPNTRIYQMSSAPHGSGPFPPASNKSGDLVGLAALKPLDYRPVVRALFAAMDRWVTEGVAPPPSGRLEDRP